MKNVFYAVASACLVAFTITVIILLRSVQSDLHAVQGDIHSLVLPAQKAEASIAAASLTLAQVGAEERNAFADQDAYYRRVSANTTLVLQSANDTIQRFNSDVLPRVSGNLDASQRLIDDSRHELAGVALSAQAAIGAAEAPLESITKAADDIQPILQNTASMTGHADATSANIEAATADIAQFVHRETTPVRGTWNVIKAFLREFAGPAAQVATAVK